MTSSTSVFHRNTTMETGDVANALKQWWTGLTYLVRFALEAQLALNSPDLRWKWTKLVVVWLSMLQDKRLEVLQTNLKLMSALMATHSTPGHVLNDHLQRHILRIRKNLQTFLVSNENPAPGSIERWYYISPPSSG